VMYRPGKQGTDLDVVGIKEVHDKFGVPPEKVIDVLALTGDSSDNVPGVPGVGEKTAIPLVQKYGSLEEIYRRLDDIPQEGLRTKLKTHRDLAFLSKQLVTIKTDVSLPISFHQLQARDPDTERLAALFEELDFRSLLSRLRASSPEKGQTAVRQEPEEPAVEFSSPSDILTDEHQYHLVTTVSDFQALCAALGNADQFVFDTETTSTNPLRAELVGLSFAMHPREAFYVALVPPDREQKEDLFSGKRSGKRTPPAGITLQLLTDALRPIMQNSSIRKIGHNLKYDMLVLSRYGLEVEGAITDTMITSYILRAGGQHNLDTVVFEYLNYKKVSYKELTGTGKEQKDIRDVPVSALCDYSCEDADFTFRLHEHLGGLVREQGMEQLAEEVEYPLVAVLARMEAAGVAVDTRFLKGMSKELDRQLETLSRAIQEMAGGAFNINSTQQLADVLFNRLKLQPVRKTKSGFSTDVAVLETLRQAHPIIERLLEYRQLTKLKSTYVDAIPHLINPATGRVHTSFNQTVTTTGRLSSSEPNLQNIPIRTELGRSIRQAFVPGSPDARIMSADYSQIELRVMAHISGDEGLAEAFQNREDIHSTTAVKIFGVPRSDVSRDMRRKAKEVNFGIMYGIGPYGLSSRLEITQTEAKDIIARYFERFPKVKQYINDTIESARRLGYVSTLLGRRRYFSDINSGNQTVRQNAERQAINMPIQGTAADMIKVAMVRIDRALRRQRLESRMILQVHDELVFEVPATEEKKMRSLVEENMRHALELSVPIDVEIGVGKNWLEAH